MVFAVLTVMHMGFTIDTLSCSYCYLSPNVAYLQHETFSFIRQHLCPAISLGDRFCDSRKGGTGGGGWVHPEGANSMAVSGLRGRKVLVGTGRAISITFGINGVRK